MIAEYWIIKKQNVNVPELYRPHGMYRYWQGINWRALLALCVGFVPVLPGLINSITPSIYISEGAQNLYALSYIYSFSSAMLVFCVCSWLWPARESYPIKNVHSDDVGYGMPGFRADRGDYAQEISH
jgi:NCS1 family nucleobase:cation symporter-1